MAYRGSEDYKIDGKLASTAVSDLETISDTGSRAGFATAQARGRMEGSSMLGEGLMAMGKSALAEGKRSMEEELERKRLAAAEQIALAKQDRLWEREDQKWARDRAAKIEEMGWKKQEKDANLREAEYDKVQGEVSGSEKVRFETLLKTDPDYVKMVIETAKRKGVDPADALSTMGQESGFKVDPLMRGTTDTKYGKAYSNWQVMKPLHPNFPTNDTELAQMQGKGRYEGMDLKAAQADYAIGYLAEVGPKGYYGTGKAPDGHPDPEMYVRQHRNRSAWIGNALNSVIGEDGSYDVTRFRSGSKETKKTDTTTAGEPEKNGMQWYMGLKEGEKKDVAVEHDKFKSAVGEKVYQAFLAKGYTPYDMQREIVNAGGADGLLAKLRKDAAARAAKKSADTKRPEPTAAVPEDKGGMMKKEAQAATPEPAKPALTPRPTAPEPVKVNPDSPAANLDRITSGLTPEVKKDVLGYVEDLRGMGFSDRQISVAARKYLEDGVDLRQQTYRSM